MYEKDIYHWASSSTQKSTCTVEPGTVEDVGKIVHLSSSFFLQLADFSASAANHEPDTHSIWRTPVSLFYSTEYLRALVTDKERWSYLES